MNKGSFLIRAGGVVLGSGLLALALVPFSRGTSSPKHAVPTTVVRGKQASPPVSPSTPTSAVRSASFPRGEEPLRADAPPPSNSSSTPGPSQPAPAVAGMVVGIDPETGRIGMPTPEQLKALSAREAMRVSKSPKDVVEIHNPDGSVTVDLQGNFQEYTTVRTGSDGKLIIECVDGAENAERLLRAPIDKEATSKPPAPVSGGEER